MSRKYFGTDGIRGKVGESVLTPEFVLKLGWAAGKVLRKNGGDGRILIGKDTRISGYMFESALEAGLASAGVNIELLGPMPTPAIAYLTQTLRASGGIVISASHNPYYDNGIKFLSANGAKLPDEMEQAIEDLLSQPMDCVDSSILGKAVRLKDASGRYIEFCKSKFPDELSLNGLKIVVDCANGAAYQIAPAVFSELGAKVVRVGTEPNGFNINQDCGATKPQAMAELVVEHKADLGIALDGDGDRVMLVDHLGEIVDGDEILYILASTRLIKEAPGTGVVGTVMSNIGLELALKELGIEFRRANVGDRYVMQILEQEGWLLGGETSGHIICRSKSPTGDGIVSALQVLSGMVGLGKTLHELKQGMRKYPQIMINVPLAGKTNPCHHASVKKAVSDAEQTLNGQGRVLLRPSGTEPLLRVMVEGRDADQVNQLAKGIAEVVAGVC
ncbi:MAG: phosphoglucosamine mutase [Gammaproteobacteria bacterium]|nr:phosphoglucosamine mutase [Gammaproteobacteria bacterium]